jgi:hypothetical protein
MLPSLRKEGAKNKLTGLVKVKSKEDMFKANIHRMSELCVEYKNFIVIFDDTETCFDFQRYLAKEQGLVQ